MINRVGAVILAFLIYGQALAADRRERTGSIRVGNRTRTHLLHIPPAHDGRRRLPLVIALHGGGGAGEGMVKMTGLSELADTRGFVVVYPNGTGRLRTKLLTWNAGNCCGQALDENVDEVGFFRELLAVLEKEWRIDSDRVFVTGISNGGMLAYRLACEMSDKIAGIAPVAGALNVDCKPSHPVSVLAFNGTADEHVLYEGGAPKKQADRRHPRRDRSVAEAISFWTTHDSCPTPPRRSEKGSLVRDLYSSCRDGTAVELVTIRGGGHAWPGGQKWARWADQPTQEISATEAMWKFFEAHPKKRSP